MNITQSEKLFHKACEIMPGGVNSPVRAFKSVGGNPLFVKKANGSKIWDVDGNEYIDYVMALGPITLGYNYESINQAIISQLKEGILFSLPHPIEVELSEKICNIIMKHSLQCSDLLRKSYYNDCQVCHYLVTSTVTSGGQTAGTLLFS